VQEFNRNPSIPLFLISLKAGGTGLNLTGADMVIHYDPWWNPAVENQATDRAYRIGQKRTVYSVKLIAQDSIEERVLALQRKKQKLYNATLEDDDSAADVHNLTWEDVQELLAL
jgi:SNF2 family DNA or RNA helicase